MRSLDPLTLDLSGLRLIEASAGTGKTHTITTLYLRCLLERELDVARILVVTFTNAATAELRTRIRARLLLALRALCSGESLPNDEVLCTLLKRRREQAEADARRLEQALRGFDEAAIYTIHGFCQRVLQDHAFESGTTFDCELVTDLAGLLSEIVEDFWCAQLAEKEHKWVAQLMEAGRLNFADLAQLVLRHPQIPVLPEKPDGDDSVLALRLQLIDYTRKEAARRKKQRNQQYFDDLLHHVYHALKVDGGPPLAAAIAQRYPVVLIDEFQDTDPVQYAIFDLVYGQRSETALILVGDPKQAIYAFRGADVFAYLEAKKKAGKPQTLNVSHRSDAPLICAINALFGARSDFAPGSFLLEGIPFAKMRPADSASNRLVGAAPMEFLLLPAPDGKKLISKGWLNQQLPTLIAARIARDLSCGITIDGKPLEPSDIAVLCRKNEQAFRLQEALRAQGISAVLYGDASVFDSPEAEQLERMLRALADPSDTRAVTAALATPLCGLNAEELFAARNDDVRWDAWLQRFHQWHEAWRTHGFMPAFQRFLDEAERMPRILGMVNGERRMTNFLHLAELLQNAAAEHRHRPFALVDWLALMRRDEVARTAAVGESSQIRLESDADALILTTIHKSKGLEYPVVYCPYLWDARLPNKSDSVLFHDPRAGWQLALHLCPDEEEIARECADWEELAENIRLAYVAVTRARHRCCIVWGKIKQAERSALAYLLHRPAVRLDANTLADEIKAAYAAMDDDDIRASLEELAKISCGAIQISELKLEDGPFYTPKPRESSELTVRRLARPVRRGWWVSSFSALTFGAAGVEAIGEVAADHDEREAVVGEPIVTEPEPVVLHEFPVGPRSGNLIHSIFEHLDFQQAAERAVLRGHVERELFAYGMEVQWVDPLCRMVDDVLRVPLETRAGALRLCDVPLERRLCEFEFLIPAAFTVGGMEARLTAAALADVFEHHAAPASDPEYAKRLRQLDFVALSGFLRGFIDLVFQHGSSWYLVDYKSNWLGTQPADYCPKRLFAAMSEHHYFLQYHLYTVALHRYLRARVPGYDYDRDFGAVYYLFVRGMSPVYPAANGVFHDRPSRALVEDLSDLLAGQSGFTLAAN